MSMTGLSAAGLSAAVNALGPRAEWTASPSDSSGRGPSHNVIRFTAPAPLQVENRQEATSADRRGASAAARSPDLETSGTSGPGRRRQDAYDALRRFDEQSERLSELIDRFEKTAGRIKRHLRADHASPALDSRQFGDLDSSPTIVAESRRTNPSVLAATSSRSSPGSALDVVA